jgi:hypothetical protein
MTKPPFAQGPRSPASTSSAGLHQPLACLGWWRAPTSAASEPRPDGVGTALKVGDRPQTAATMLLRVLLAVGASRRAGRRPG